MAWQSPIIDRTLADIDALLAKLSLVNTLGWSNLSAEQKADWLSDHKGAFNSSDNDRLIANITYLNDLLISDFGIDAGISPMTGGLGKDVYYTLSNFDTIRANINKLTSASYKYATTPNVNFSTTVNYQIMNDLEKILVDLKEILEKIPIGFVYCGSFSCGQSTIL